MNDQEEPMEQTTAVERYEPGEISPRRWEQMEREARVFAKSGKVPKEYAGQPDAIMAVLITAEELGMKAGLSALKAFHFIEGSAVPSAQLMVALARAGGHDIRTTFLDETRCVVEGRRRGSAEPEEFSYSIDQARRAGQLDPWVERWQDNQNGKRYLERYLLKVRGGDNPLPMPEWAKKLADSGHTKIKDAWYRYPEDLLKASAIRRACRAICPDVLLGLPSVDTEDLSGGPARSSDPSAGPAPAVQHQRVDQVIEKDEVVDAEIVEDGEPDRGQGDEPESDTRESAEPDGEAAPDAVVDVPLEPEPAPDPALVDDVWRRDFAIACTNVGLSEDQRHELLRLGTSGRIRSSKQLRKREVADVSRWLRRYLDGEYAFVTLPDGNEALVPRVPGSDPQRPLEESA